MSNKGIDGQGGSNNETIFRHFESTLDIEMPKFWKTLGQYAPWALESYYAMREPVFRDVDEGGSIPKRYKELTVVAMDILQNNPWGVRVHTRAAIRAGATMQDVAETVVLSILAGGMISYRLAGAVAFEAAEEALEELEKERSNSGTS